MKSYIYGMNGNEKGKDLFVPY